MAESASRILGFCSVVLLFCVVGGGYCDVSCLVPCCLVLRRSCVVMYCVIMCFLVLSCVGVLCCVVFCSVFCCVVLRCVVSKYWKGVNNWTVVCVTTPLSWREVLTTELTKTTQHYTTHCFLTEPGTDWDNTSEDRRTTTDNMGKYRTTFDNPGK